MSKSRTKRQKAIIKRRIFLSVCAIVVIGAIVAVSFAINGIINAFKGGEPWDTSSNGKDNSSSHGEGPDEPYKVSSATVVNIGDILIHDTIFKGAYNSSTGDYDFSAFFTHAKNFFKKADYAVANLEVTFGGTQSGKYSGYPVFNTPDSLADTIKGAGIDMLLTSNNHCYDTGLFGLKRTLQVLDDKKLEHTGTRESNDAPTYLIKDVNGIKIGMICYTYETGGSQAGRKYINGGIVASEANSLINSFDYNKIDAFYTEAQQKITEMRNKGADCVVFYMHWGNEYQLKQNTWQSTIAQKLCDFGVDVIVGGHPHVIQPIQLLHSEDSQNTTVCVYSTGNAISNQRKELMVPECTTGHTEDSMLFYYTFDKYSDGTTVLSGVDIVPAWVNKYKGGSGYLYTMIPLESPTDGETLYGLDAATAVKTNASYERTKAIIAAGLTECQQALGCKIRFS